MVHRNNQELRMKMVVSILGVGLIAFKIINIITLCTAEKVIGEGYLNSSSQGFFSNNIGDHELIFPKKLTRSAPNNLDHYVTHFWEDDPFIRRRKRDLDADKVHYYVPINGKETHVVVTPNYDAFPEHIVVEHYDLDSAFNVGKTRLRRTNEQKCYYKGHIVGQPDSKVALSACKGLAGYIRSDDGDYLIEPVSGYDPGEESHPHILYKPKLQRKNGRSSCKVNKERLNENEVSKEQEYLDREYDAPIFHSGSSERRELAKSKSHGGSFSREIDEIKPVKTYKRINKVNHKSVRKNKYERLDGPSKTRHDNYKKSHSGFSRKKENKFVDSYSSDGELEDNNREDMEVGCSGNSAFSKMQKTMIEKGAEDLRRMPKMNKKTGKLMGKKMYRNLHSKHVRKEESIPLELKDISQGKDQGMVPVNELPSIQKSSNRDFAIRDSNLAVKNSETSGMVNDYLPKRGMEKTHFNSNVLGGNLSTGSKIAPAEPWEENIELRPSKYSKEDSDNSYDLPDEGKSNLQNNNDKSEEERRSSPNMTLPGSGYYSFYMNTSSSQAEDQDETAVGHSNEVSRKRRFIQYKSCKLPPVCRNKTEPSWDLRVLIVVSFMFSQRHKDIDLETFVLTIMNMVTNNFHEQSLGVLLTVKLVRMVFIEYRMEELDEVKNSMEELFENFCTFQHRINPRKFDHPNHHDVGVLISSMGICAENLILGVTNYASICRLDKSCIVAVDEGLLLANIITHQIGHSLGADHDDRNFGSCPAKEPDGKTYYFMGPEITMNGTRWSKCSGDAIRRFIWNRGSRCMRHLSQDMNFDWADILPGQIYNPVQQCTLNFHMPMLPCYTGDFCKFLYCQVNRKQCVSKLEPPADGTLCATGMWCIRGICVTKGRHPGMVNGEWSGWGPWNSCSRTCGGGVQRSVRLCNNPAPALGGRYCVGGRIRHRMCNTQVGCDPFAMSFREMQCRETEDLPFRGDYYTWTEYVNNFAYVECSLICESETGIVAVRSLNVDDGTPCKPGTKNVCIQGTCVEIGCDWGINSGAVTDACGVCHGNGTECRVIQGIFTEKLGKGYVPFMKVPRGSGMIYARELNPSDVQFVVTSFNTGTYFLNPPRETDKDNRPGDFYFGGVKGIYSIRGKMERIFIPGPTDEDLVFFIKYNKDPNPGIRYQFAIPETDPNYVPSYSWQFIEWDMCSDACGGGQQKARARCVEDQAGVVENRYCLDTEKPLDIVRSCNEFPCLPKWWVGSWSDCINLGSECVRYRSVLCMRTRDPSSLRNEILKDKCCCDEEKPVSVKRCNETADMVNMERCEDETEEQEMCEEKDESLVSLPNVFNTDYLLAHLAWDYNGDEDNEKDEYTALRNHQSLSNVTSELIKEYSPSSSKHLDDVDQGVYKNMVSEVNEDQVAAAPEGIGGSAGKRRNQAKAKIVQGQKLMHKGVEKPVSSGQQKVEGKPLSGGSSEKEDSKKWSGSKIASEALQRKLDPNKKERENAAKISVSLSDVEKHEYKGSKLAGSNGNGSTPGPLCKGQPGWSICSSTMPPLSLPAETTCSLKRQSECAQMPTELTNEPKAVTTTRPPCPIIDQLVLDDFLLSVIPIMCDKHIYHRGDSDFQTFHETGTWSYGLESNKTILVGERALAFLISARNNLTRQPFIYHAEN